ncbi:MAG: PHP domain-containing protein, partial [Trueperaceae bacterium]
KTQDRIVEGVASVRRFAERTRRADAARTVTPLLAWLRDDGSVQRLELAGSYRRGRDTVGDLDLLALTSDQDATMARLRAYDDVERVLGSGRDKSSVVLSGGLQVDLRTIAAEGFGAALQYFTGSQAHNVRLRQRAAARDLTLNEYGLWRKNGDQRVAGEDEAGIYRALDLPWIAPELREDRGEIAAAEDDRLPRLLERSDLIADLHVHSDWSDGRGDLLAMMRAAREAGLSVLAFTDHGPALRMTGGLDRDKLLRQWRALDELDGEVPGLTVLRGLEVDVHPDGSLDMDDEMLERLDLVIISVHGGFDLPEDRQTERVVRALQHPQVNVLAHPTGRLIGRREGIRIDLHAVIHAAAANGVALEINANPARLDLNDRWARVALQAGVPISVASDAHAPEGIAVLEHGVLQARRAWATADRVINAWPLDRLRRFLAKTPSDAEPPS